MTAEKSTTESTCTGKSADEDEGEGKVRAEGEATAQHGPEPIVPYGEHHHSHGADDGVDGGKNVRSRTPPLGLYEFNLIRRPAPTPPIRSAVIEEAYARANRLESPLEEAHGLARPQRRESGVLAVRNPDRYSRSDA